MFIHCPPKELPDLESVTQDNGVRFYTLPNGDVVPSITTVLACDPEKNVILENWRTRVGVEKSKKISTYSAGRGKKLHDIIEKYLNNEDKYLGSSFPDIVSLFKGIKPYLDRMNNIWYQEQSLYSYKIKIAGKVDCIAEFDGKLSIIDFKTSTKTKRKEWIDSYFAQCTAYSIMGEELLGTPIEQIVVLIAVEEGPPQYFVENTKNYIPVLQQYINEYKKIHLV
jgi:genome maintenance exonuclease 1